MVVEAYKAIQPQVQLWSKTTYDIHKEKLSDARDVGDVRLNNSRLNVFSSLKKEDKVDHFKFDIQSNGKFRIGMTDNPELRVELLNSRGKVIADGDANSGDALFHKFLELNEDGLELDKGTYYVRISRKSTDPDKTEYTYSLQLSMGDTYIHDYDTLEKPPAEAFDPMTAALEGAVVPSRYGALQGAASLLTNGMITLLNDGKLFGGGDNS